MTLEVGVFVMAGNHQKLTHVGLRKNQVVVAFEQAVN